MNVLAYVKYFIDIMPIIETNFFLSIFCNNYTYFDANENLFPVNEGQKVWNTHLLPFL